MQASPPKSKPASAPARLATPLVDTGGYGRLATPVPKRGRPPTGVKTPWKELNISKATYYRRIRLL